MNRKLLEEVCCTLGIPGYEDAIQNVVQKFLDRVCDETSRDRVGNVIGVKRPIRLSMATGLSESS